MRDTKERSAPFDRYSSNFHVDHVSRVVGVLLGILKSNTANSILNAQIVLSPRSLDADSRLIPSRALKLCRLANAFVSAEHEAANASWISDVDQTDR